EKAREVSSEPSRRVAPTLQVFSSASLRPSASLRDTLRFLRVKRSALAFARQVGRGHGRAIGPRGGPTEPAELPVGRGDDDGEAAAAIIDQVQGDRGAGEAPSLAAGGGSGQRRGPGGDGGPP